MVDLHKTELKTWQKTGVPSSCSVNRESPEKIIFHQKMTCNFDDPEVSIVWRHGIQNHRQWLFVQQIVLANNQENTKALHYQSIVSITSPLWGELQKVFPCYEVIMHHLKQNISCELMPSKYTNINDDYMQLFHWVNTRDCLWGKHIQCDCFRGNHDLVFDYDHHATGPLISTK